MSISFDQRNILVARHVVILVDFHASSTFPNLQPFRIKFRRRFRLSQNLKALKMWWFNCYYVTIFTSHEQNHKYQLLQHRKKFLILCNGFFIQWLICICNVPSVLHQYSGIVTTSIPVFVVVIYATSRSCLIMINLLFLRILKWNKQKCPANVCAA